MKKNKKKLFTNIAIASALSFAVVGVGVATIYNNDYQITRAVEYDDEHEIIVLSITESYTYSFNHFFDYCVDYYTANESFEFSIYPSDYETAVSYEVEYDGSDIDNIIFNDDDNGNWYVSFTNYSTGAVFNYFYLNDIQNDSPLIILCNTGYYTDIKNAIELDIQANQPRGMGGALQDFISILTGGIVRLANGVATGVADFAKALFLTVDNGGAVTGLSIFGGIVAIFAGLALAVGITTKVYTWITSLGN